MSVYIKLYLCIYIKKKKACDCEYLLSGKIHRELVVVAARKGNSALGKLGRSESCFSVYKYVLW